MAAGQLQGSCRAGPRPRGCRSVAVQRRSRPEAPPTPPALTPVCFRLGRVARVSSLLRKLKGEGGEVSVAFDPKLWSKEGCHNRRYMLPGIACSVSRRAAPHRTAPHRTAPLPACRRACFPGFRLPACLPAYLPTCVAYNRKARFFDLL